MSGKGSRNTKGFIRQGRFYILVESNAVHLYRPILYFYFYYHKITSRVMQHGIARWMVFVANPRQLAVEHHGYWKQGFEIPFYSRSLRYSRQLHADCHNQHFALSVFHTLFYNLLSTPASCFTLYLHSAVFNEVQSGSGMNQLGPCGDYKSFSPIPLDTFNGLLLFYSFTQVSLLYGLLPLFMQFRHHSKEAVATHPAPHESEHELSEAACRRF